MRRRDFLKGLVALPVLGCVGKTLSCSHDAGRVVCEPTREPDMIYNGTPVWCREGAFEDALKVQYGGYIEIWEPPKVKGIIHGLVT